MTKIEYQLSLRSTKTFAKSPESLAASLKAGAYDECYELIPMDAEFKPYFDIDIKNEDAEKSDEILNDAIAYLKTEFGSDIDVAVSDASKPGEKISYHLVITNRRTTMSDMFSVSRYFKKPFDTAVYRGTKASHPQKFRTIYSIKGKRELVPVTHVNNLTDHFVTNVREDVPVYTHKKPEKPAKPEKPEKVKYLMNDYRREYVEYKTDIGRVLTQTDDRAEWFRIGVSLYAVYGDAKGRAQFLEYSERHPSHDMRNFENAWNSIIEKKYSNGGWGLLKKHLPNEYYDEYVPRNPPNDIKNDEMVSKWFLDTFTKYKLRYCDKDYYAYSGQVWQRISKYSIIRDIAETLGRAYEIVAREETDPDRQKCAHRNSQCVSSYDFWVKITKSIAVFVNDDDFRNKLDQNRYILGFKDGVLDLRTKEFRPGTEFDYISITTGTNYPKEYNTEKLTYLNDLLFKICCEDNERLDALLDMLGRSMIGDNSVCSQNFICMYGRGGNGKSIVATLVKETFGDYCKTVPTSLITQKAQRADGANPEISNMVGARYAFMSETEESEKLNPQTLKTHTGENKISYRCLFSNNINITNITWTMFLMTNDKLKLNFDDVGLARRFVYVPFKARFVDDPDPAGNTDYPEYKRDHNLMTAIKQYTAEFFHLLLERLDHTKKLEFGGKIKAETIELVQGQDHLTDMLRASVEPSDNIRHGITWADLKKLLLDQHSIRFRTIKDKETDKDMLDKVKARLPKVLLTTGCATRRIKYIDQFGLERTTRSPVFMGIKLVDDDGDEF
jgi:P4 family phage/plasmid primase-like protien